METLVINGSPRRGGETASLTNALKELLQGDVEEIWAWDADTAPCVDCRSCWTHSGCAVKDGWEKTDAILRRCQSVVVATPLYFSQPTGPLLSFLSRTQQYYCARRFLGEPPKFPVKRGAVLLTGGGDGSPELAAETLRPPMRLMGCKEFAPILCCHHTDSIPALQEPGVHKQLKALADFLEGRDTP